MPRTMRPHVGPAGQCSANCAAFAFGRQTTQSHTQQTRDDGRYLVARVGSELWANTVGTFGVGSAGYWWGRAGSALIRLAHYLQGKDHMLWLLLYSDDSWATAHGEHAEKDLMLHLFVLMILGTPLAWHKLKGGIEVEWIGYALDLAGYYYLFGKCLLEDPQFHAKF